MEEEQYETGTMTSDDLLPIGLPDRYHLRGLIGSGGMGSVYLAQDLLLGNQVAIKVLHEELCATQDSRSRFLREARALASLRHSNIVNI